jgi:hypothetical protein
VPGEPGPQGPAGSDGAAGAAGAQGEKGIDGAPGVKGDPGGDGRDGRDGKDGRDGAAGRDGADIQPLPAIDAAKSYPPGIWAKHAGGLWVSRSHTDAMNGWDCVVNGIDTISMGVGDDLRTLSLSVRCSNGQVVEQTKALPVVLYRGIWREGEIYAKGDSSTRDGSTWILMADEQKGQPGEADSGWVLATKRGRDGRDGVKGEKGERGAEGRAGKDILASLPSGNRL